MPHISVVRRLRIRRLTLFTCTGLALIGLLGIPARAAVVPIAWYKLGEDDPGAVANAAGQNPTQDSTANSFDLARAGSPTYRADTAPNSLGSTLSMELNGATDYYSRTNAVTTLTSNVGIEAWAKPDAAAAP